MNKLSIILLSFVGVIVLVGLVIGSWWLGTYNGLVSSNESVTTQWSQVETQYQRRFDLIPNLVNATKGFLKQEQKVFGDIAEARTHYASAASGTGTRMVMNSSDNDLTFYNSSNAIVSQIGGGASSSF